MFHAILTIHIFSGTLGLMLGPVALLARKRKGRHTNFGEAYHWTMLLVCFTASAVAILQWEKNWYFLFIGLFSYWNAFKGYRAAKKRPPGWLATHIAGMSGSYIALVTAFFVVNVSSVTGIHSLLTLTAWILPTLIGVPLISRVQRRYVE